MCLVHQHTKCTALHSASNCRNCVAGANLPRFRSKFVAPAGSGGGGLGLQARKQEEMLEWRRMQFLLPLLLLLLILLALLSALLALALSASFRSARSFPLASLAALVVKLRKADSFSFRFPHCSLFGTATPNQGNGCACVGRHSSPTSGKIASQIAKRRPERLEGMKRGPCTYKSAC